MKKFYISSDIEGTSGICDWGETEKGNSYYDKYAEKMTKEVASVCNGINKAYEDCKILVKDAHDSARNIIHEMLPKNVDLNRGWSRDPLIMMNEIDKGFDASIFTGYHSGSNLAGSPLAHTMNVESNVYMKINGETATEFLYNYYISHYYNVPVVMVTGDEELCKHVKKINPNIETVVTQTGRGSSVTAKHPAVVLEEMEETAKRAVQNIEKCRIKMPEHFEFELCLKTAKEAYKASFYPGVKLINDTTIKFETDDFYELMRMYLFI